MFVIDASALLDVFTVDPGDIPTLARRVRDAEWMSAPDLIDYEFLNVLRRMVARGEIDGELAEASRLAVRDLRLSRYPMTDRRSDRVWTLRHNLSAYDAAYLALAEELGVPLVTTDLRLAEASRQVSSVQAEGYGPG